MFVCKCVCPFVNVSVCLYVKSLSIREGVCLFVCKCVCPFVRVSVCLYVNVFVHL